MVYHVCANSLIRHSSTPVSITPLALTNLKDYVEQHADGSNDFIYSRFLVPHLTNFSGWGLYLDGDMLLRADITTLWSMRDSTKAVLCAHHNYKTKQQSKYLGARNDDYPRKNWSSVVLWNCEHPANRVLTPTFVAKATGAQLHRFTWLADALIGELPKEWNWLPDEFGENPDAKLLHWTLGAPCFHEYADTAMASEWHRERLLANFCSQHAVVKD